MFFFYSAFNHSAVLHHHHLHNSTHKHCEEPDVNRASAPLENSRPAIDNCLWTKHAHIFEICIFFMSDNVNLNEYLCDFSMSVCSSSVKQWKWFMHLKLKTNDGPEHFKHDCAPNTTSNARSKSRNEIKRKWVVHFWVSRLFDSDLLSGQQSPYMHWPGLLQHITFMSKYTLKKVVYDLLFPLRNCKLILQKTPKKQPVTR